MLSMTTTWCRNAVTIDMVNIMTSAHHVYNILFDVGVMQDFVLRM